MEAVTEEERVVQTSLGPIRLTDEELARRRNFVSWVMNGTDDFGKLALSPLSPEPLPPRVPGPRPCWTWKNMLSAGGRKASRSTFPDGSLHLYATHAQAAFFKWNKDRNHLLQTGKQRL